MPDTYRIVCRAVAVASFAALPLSAQPAPPGMLPTRTAVIDSALDRYVADGSIPGGVLLVLRNGQPVYQRAVGWADREAARRMLPTTLFRIASQTKALTSVAIMMLIEEGRMGLNDRLSQYLPSFAQTRVATLSDTGVVLSAATRPIRIRDLLTHTAGISYGTDAVVAAKYAEQGLGPAAGNGWYTADKTEPTCASMDRLGTLPIVQQPGAAFVYGYSTDILGCIVERVSGVSLATFFATRITGPLRMRDTYFYVPRGEEQRLATVYRSDSTGRAVRAPDGARGQGHYVDGPRVSFSGGAGLISTAADYARFLEMLRRDGALDGVHILSPRSVALLRTNQTGRLQSADGATGFGFAFEVVERLGGSGYKSVGTFGWGGAYGSTYFVDPSAGLVVVWMMQLMPNTSPVQERIVPLIYQALDVLTPVTR
jgi:CubicO group peptidase (beta-lactamase class C family)